MPALNQTFELSRASNDPGGHLILALTGDGSSDTPTVETFNQAIEDMFPIWAALRTRLSPIHAVALGMIFTEQAHLLQERSVHEDTRALRGGARPVAS